MSVVPHNTKEFLTLVGTTSIAIVLLFFLFNLVIRTPVECVSTTLPNVTASLYKPVVGSPYAVIQSSSLTATVEFNTPVEYSCKSMLTSEWTQKQD